MIYNGIDPKYGLLGLACVDVRSCCVWLFRGFAQKAPQTRAWSYIGYGEILFVSVLPVVRGNFCKSIILILASENKHPVELDAGNKTKQGLQID